MQELNPVRSYGFHAGELAVQRLVGVDREAARLEGMLAPASLSAGLAAFLSDRTLAAMTARDNDGRLWTSPLMGPPGFITVADPTTLHITTSLSPGDPLRATTPEQPVGLIAIDYDRRRRFRINGTLSSAGQEFLSVSVEQAYGNCPQFIPQRRLDLLDTDPGAGEGLFREPAGEALTETDHALIRTADTFFLGTTHPDRGSDASHRGGPPGFVHVDGNDLWWPDYAGNNMFNSLGNLHTNPEAALLFLDLADHSALHLSGTAELVPVEVGSPGDDGRTGRRIVFTAQRRVRTSLPAQLVTSVPNTGRAVDHRAKSEDNA